MNNSTVAVPPTTSSLASSNIEVPREEIPELPSNLYTPFINDLQTNRDKNGFSDIQFDKLLMITDNSDTRELLNKMLVGMYETNTTRLVEINTEIEKLQGELRSSITEINETEHDIRELEDDESTIKRKSQIELNEIRRTEYQNYHLIIVLSISVVALLFPILNLFGVLNGVVSTIIYVLIMTIVAGYAGYYLWYKLLDVDPNDFSKKNTSQDIELRETDEEDRNCLPSDEEDTFDKINEEPCVNPAELIIPDEKMEEYLDPKCSLEGKGTRV